MKLSPRSSIAGPEYDPEPSQQPARRGARRAAIAAALGLLALLAVPLDHVFALDFELIFESSKSENPPDDSDGSLLQENMETAVFEAPTSESDTRKSGICLLKPNTCWIPGGC